MKLTAVQQRVLASIVEGAGTTQRFGRWARPTYDALKRRGLITTTKLDAPADCYALWRVDLTAEGRSLRDGLTGSVEPFPFPEYPSRPLDESCWHDPHYPAGEWRCPLKMGHANFHRYVPIERIRLEQPR